MSFLVSVIPSIPEPLVEVFQAFHIDPDILSTVPQQVSPRPFLLIADVTNFGERELQQLAAFNKHSIVLGVIHRSITPESNRLLKQLSGVFILPHHNEALRQLVTRLLSRSEEKFPRFTDAFQVQVQIGGAQTYFYRGFDYSLEGCAFQTDILLEPGTRLSGTMFLEGALHGYPFVGETVYSKRIPDGWRCGIRMDVLSTHSSSFRTYMRKRFESILRKEWAHEAGPV